MKIIGYIVSGYPTIEKSTEVAKYYVEGGCDMLEIGIPLINNREAPFLSDLMKEAYSNNSNYDEHLEGIRKIAKEFPDLQITILLYNEVALKIGAEKLAKFCDECGIKDINSGDLRDENALKIFKEHKIRLAGLVRYALEDDSIEDSKNTDGFIYVQAFPREGQVIKPGYETLDKVIAYIRKNGISNSIYCGGGIRTPEDAKLVKNAGADGFFLGTSVITLMDQPEKLISTIKEFKAAIDD